MSKISELSDGGVIQGGDTLIAVRSGGNVKVTYGGTTTANIDGGTIDGTVIGGSTAAAGSFTTLTASGEITASGGIALGDNDKATFGASDDLQIYHDGSNSYITDAGTGDLNILASNFGLKSGSGSLSYLTTNSATGAVSLYKGTAKLVTTDTGVDVTGVAKASQFQVVDSTAAIYRNGNNLELITYAGYSINLIPSAFVNIATTTSNYAGTKLNVGDNADSQNGLSIQTSPTGDGYVLFSDGSTGTQGYTGQIRYNHASDFMAFGVNGGTERMRISSAGDLLVGVTAPVTLPDNSVGGGVSMSTDGQIIAGRNNAAPASFKRTTTDGDIVTFHKDGSTVGSIGARGGDVYLETGTTGILMYDAQDAIIPVQSTGIARDAAINLGISNIRFKDLYLSGNINLSASSQINSSTAFYLDSDIIHFRRNNEAESARIDSSGNLLVGTTDNIIWNDTSGEGVVIGPNAIQIARVSDSCLLLNRQSTDGILQVFASRGVQVGSVSVTTTATTYNTSSDQRLKENIVDAPSSSDDIDAIQVRSFDWKADGSHQKYGMIAQELMTVAPEAVSGDPESDEMMGVDYSKLVPMLIKEIQSLRARVAQLETN